MVWITPPLGQSDTVSRSGHASKRKRKRRVLPRYRSSLLSLIIYIFQSAGKTGDYTIFVWEPSVDKVRHLPSLVDSGKDAMSVSIWVTRPIVRYSYRCMVDTPQVPFSPPNTVSSSIMHWLQLQNRGGHLTIDTRWGGSFSSSRHNTICCTHHLHSREQPVSPRAGSGKRRTQSGCGAGCKVIRPFLYHLWGKQAGRH